MAEAVHKKRKPAVSAFQWFTLLVIAACVWTYRSRTRIAAALQVRQRDQAA